MKRYIVVSARGQTPVWSVGVTSARVIGLEMLGSPPDAPASVYTVPRIDYRAPARFQGVRVPSVQPPKGDP